MTIHINRRAILTGLFAATAAEILPNEAEAGWLFKGKPVEIKFYNRHTAETIHVDLANPDMAKISEFMGDFRAKKVKNIDRKLIEKLADTVTILRDDGRKVPQLDLISGFRTVETNMMLNRTRGGGAVLESQHCHARASDIDIPGLGLSNIHKASVAVAKKDGFGGVGIYTGDRFVHIDSRRNKLALW